MKKTCTTPKALRQARYQEPSLAVVDSDVVLRLPEPLTTTLAECEPNFHPWGLRDFSRAARPVDPDTLGPSIRELPSAVVGDFNGDSMADIAVEGRTDTFDLLLVLLSSDTGYDVVVLDRTPLSAFGGRHPGNIDGPPGLSDTYLVLVRPGLIAPPVGNDSVDLHTDAFALNLSDKVSSMCYYRNGRFVWLQVGD